MGNNVCKKCKKLLPEGYKYDNGSVLGVKKRGAVGRVRQNSGKRAFGLGKMLVPHTVRKLTGERINKLNVGVHMHMSVLPQALGGYSCRQTVKKPCLIEKRKITH